MQKLNGLGVELYSLKKEMLDDKYSSIIKQALSLSAEKMVQTEMIDVDLHLSLTNSKLTLDAFEKELLDNPICLKTEEEMHTEYEKVREIIQEKIDESGLQLTSESLVETEQLSFAKTFKLDKLWVSEYFGQPEGEVDKLMVRNGFVEKFAVLRLSKVLDAFVNSELFKTHETILCKPTHVFYDVEGGYYGIHLMFYINIEKAEDEERNVELIDYMKEVVLTTKTYVDERFVS